ncbi:efflux RND transporter periplasmic adaptor subunit [Fontimonas sp. SYSU GA230001]|uniref:efflux RND transporter periplasmic adaptor subunit n=1 Tax=Fontimonas sp. SYSU GA230001 TaxID=3142450 RepID=UPI0032B53889
MNDTSSLLGQLKIDRGTPASPNPGRRLAWLLALAAAIAVTGGWLLHRPDVVPVKLVSARTVSDPGTATSVLDASGYVIARRQATVSSKVTGKVVAVMVEEGQAVRAGDVLARIDDSNARTQLALARSQRDAARAQLAEVRVQLDEARRQLQRTRELATRKLVSEQVLDNAQAAVDGLAARLETTERNVAVAERSVAVQEQLLDDTVVRAPFDGVITVKNAQPGEMISPLSAGGAGTRTGIGTLVDMDSLEVEVDVNENFINRVRPGQPVTARLNAYPDWSIPARVIAVVPAADRSKATVRVRVGLEVQDARILPDMGVRVAFMDAPDKAGAARAAVVVPAEAVTQDQGADVVYVVTGERLERRAVRVEGRSADGLRIAAGLTGGERLAVGDFTRLRDGVRVRVEP